MAVDTKSGTFWASKFDDTGNPVEFVVDLGRRMQLRSAELAWEFPAKAFSVSLSEDGDHYEEVFATDTNVLKTTRLLLNGLDARTLKVQMYEVPVIVLLIDQFRCVVASHIRYIPSLNSYPTSW